MLWRRAMSLLGAGVALLIAPTRVTAQSTDFLLSTAPLTFPTPTPAHYASWPTSASGPVTDSIALPFTVDRVRQTTIRITTVLVRCAGTTGVKSCSDIEWRSGATGPWRPLSLMDETVEERTVIPMLSNDPWSGVLWFRVRIAWSDPAPSLSTSNIALTLSVYRP